jgi:hypothetical protein
MMGDRPLVSRQARGPQDPPDSCLTAALQQCSDPTPSAMQCTSTQWLRCCCCSGIRCYIHICVHPPPHPHPPRCAMPRSAAPCYWRAPPPLAAPALAAESSRSRQPAGEQGSAPLPPPLAPAPAAGCALAGGSAAAAAVAAAAAGSCCEGCGCGAGGVSGSSLKPRSASSACDEGGGQRQGRRVRACLRPPAPCAHACPPPPLPHTQHQPRACAKLGRSAGRVAQQAWMSAATRPSTPGGSTRRCPAKPTAPTTCMGLRLVQGSPPWCVGWQAWVARPACGGAGRRARPHAWRTTHDRHTTRAPATAGVLAHTHASPCPYTCITARPRRPCRAP